MANSIPFFLFLGDSDREGVVSKLKALGYEYKKKRLDSGRENWRIIFSFLDRDDLSGVLAKMTNTVFKRLALLPYRDDTRDLFCRLTRTPHIIFVHESFYTGVHTWVGDDLDDDDGYREFSLFGSLNHELRAFIQSELESDELNVVPYRTNAELSVLAAYFIDQQERNLIFRLYVPSGRLWAAEADKVIQLFRDYLNRVGGLNVRQEQHSTKQGMVYEFFADHSINPASLPQQFEEFSRFLDICATSPDQAHKALSETNLDSRTVDEIVERYSREAKRLHVDLKQERERRVLGIRHRMEAELVDLMPSEVDWDAVNQIIDDSVPTLMGVASAIGFGGSAVPPPPANQVTLNIRPQIVNHVHGIVAQEISGTQNIGPEATQLIDLIKLYGGKQGPELVSSVYELEDEDAKPEDRLTAKQKLRGFLFRVGEKISDVASGVLQAYIEHKLGL